MASKIKVDQIEGSTGSSITIPSGQTLTIADGLSSSSLPTVPVSKGGTGLTSLGTANQILQINSGATGLEFTAKPTGGIKQVIQTVKTNIQVISSTSNVDIMSVSITPSSSSSKILVSWNVNACSNDHADISVFRDATQIYLGDASGSRRRTAHAMYAIHGDHISEFSGTFLDSPNSNSSNTYYVKGSTPGSSSHSLMINISDRDLDRAQNHRTASNIMVMEVTV